MHAPPMYSYLEVFAFIQNFSPKIDIQMSLLSEAFSDHLKCNFHHSFSLSLNFSPLYLSPSDILCVLFLVVLLLSGYFPLLECQINEVMY